MARISPPPASCRLSQEKSALQLSQIQPLSVLQTLPQWFARFLHSMLKVQISCVYDLYNQFGDILSRDIITSLRGS